MGTHGHSFGRPLVVGMQQFSSSILADNTITDLAAVGQIVVLAPNGPDFDFELGNQDVNREAPCILVPGEALGDSPRLCVSRPWITTVWVFEQVCPPSPPLTQAPCRAALLCDSVLPYPVLTFLPEATLSAIPSRFASPPLNLPSSHPGTDHRPVSLGVRGGLRRTTSLLLLLQPQRRACRLLRRPRSRLRPPSRRPHPPLPAGDGDVLRAFHVGHAAGAVRPPQEVTGI